MSTIPAQPAQDRLVSLDALRGFDMFWIIGAEEIFSALHEGHRGRVAEFLFGQLSHKAWAGFAFEDLIFPLFVFVVGVSLVFSIDKSIERVGRPATVAKVVRRSVILVLLGIFMYGGLAAGLEKVRLLGVLQRIGLAYLFASLLYMGLRVRGLVAACAGCLLLYWALMTFVPVPGVGAGNFAEGKNLANYIDAQYLPYRKWDRDHDPEGLLSTLPAVGTCLLGVLAGLLLKSGRTTPRAKVGWLLLAGVLAATTGWLWHLQFPVVKKIWTSSFVLVAGGYSLVLLALFYQIIDVWRLRRWAMPFVWIGTNAITIYVGTSIINFHGLAKRLVGGPVKAHCGQWGDLLVALTAMGLILLVLRFLYKRKIFLRI
jgi:predicted acyltransferase